MDYDKEYFKTLLPKRPEDSHKGTFGHVLNVAGSEFYTGAAYFSSLAPLKVGCGKVTLASNEKVLRTVGALSPDIILMPLNKVKKEIFNNFQAISIGCGLSQEKDSVKLFEKMIGIANKTQIPVVIDADGLNILAASPLATCGRGAGGEGYNYLPTNTILTPHPKEMARLMETTVESILAQSEFWTQKGCEKYNCTIVLKSHKTIVADNKGHFYLNNTGNSALSHGGSGDVLCGMISGLLAQGLKSFEASILAVYLHGITAEIASEELTEYSVLASDLLNYIPKAIKTIL